MSVEQQNRLACASRFVEARKYAAQVAYHEEFDIDNPELQFPQWLKDAVKNLREGEEITEESLQESDRKGGTDHPDPTLHSMG